MKAIVKTLNLAVLKDVAIPEIDPINNVLIKVKCAAICRTDLNVASGAISAPEGLILGHELYGEVVAVSADAHSISIGDRVTINPTKFGEKKNLMCGVNVNGGFAEYVKVPNYLVHKLPNDIQPQLGAFTEPVAASLAVLNVKYDKTSKIGIYGSNRISELTYKILKNYGYEDVAIVNGKLPEDSYDVIIETVIKTSDFENIVTAIKHGGLIILKSRQYVPVEICVNSLVKKEIRMSAVNYGNFDEAISLLNKLDFSNLIGTMYPIEEYEKAFDEAKSGEAKKIFLEV